jgi:UbiD family decarboxylase
MDVMGGLLGEPVEMVKCKTVDLEVPARAEIVIEGIVDTDPGEGPERGPFGEYPLYYTRLGPMPWVKVTAVTMRRP